MESAEILDKAFPPEQCSEANIQACEEGPIDIMYGEPSQCSGGESPTTTFTGLDDADLTEFILHP